MTTKQKLIQKIGHLPENHPIFKKLIQEIESIEQVNMAEWSKELDEIIEDLPETIGFKPLSREEIYKDI